VKANLLEGSKHFSEALSRGRATCVGSLTFGPGLIEEPPRFLPQIMTNSSHKARQELLSVQAYVLGNWFYQLSIPSGEQQGLLGFRDVPSPVLNLQSTFRGAND
jgi:hypothetical protein